MDTETPNIQFSPSPGSRERQLRRQFNNPLFPQQHQRITQSLVDQARKEDLAEFQQFVQQFETLLDEMATLEGRVDTQVILDLKERIDRLYDLFACFEFEQAPYKQALVTLYESLMNAIRGNAGDDALALAELNKEHQAHALHLQLLEYKLVCDLLRDDSPIDETDLIPTLLSEEPESVQVAMSLFDPEQQNVIREQAARIMEGLALTDQVTNQVKFAFEAMYQPKQ